MIFFKDFLGFFEVLEGFFGLNGRWIPSGFNILILQDLNGIFSGFFRYYSLKNESNFESW